MGKQKQGEGINWTEITWNPLRGCSRQTKACESCYAEAVAVRFSGPGQPFEGLIHPVTKGWNGVIKFFPEKLDEPLRWTRPRMVFVNSVSDLFGATNHEIAAIFGVMALAGQHTFQTLTKRHKQMRAWFDWIDAEDGKARLPAEKIALCIDALETYLPGAAKGRTIPTEWPLPNVWLGVTAEDQENANNRVPALLNCDAAVYWVSAEPLLGPIDFSRWLVKEPGIGASTYQDNDGLRRCDITGELLYGLDLIVTGGESGVNARAMHPDWPRQIRDACLTNGVKFHFKQWGEFVPGPNHGNPVLNEKGYAIPSVVISTPGKDDFVRMLRVTKLKAGRLLDGVLHNDAMTEF